MKRFQFAACEWAFPCWGDLAVKMAHEAGFTGVQLGDGGGSMQGFPLRNKRVQDYYLNIAAKYGMSYPQIHLYTLGHQGYYRNRPESREGRICTESIKQGIIAASEMGVPCVTIDAMRLNDPAKKAYAITATDYAVALGEEYGINIAVETDMTLEDHFTYIDRYGGKLKLCFDTHNPCM